MSCCIKVMQAGDVPPAPRRPRGRVWQTLGAAGVTGAAKAPGVAGAVASSASAWCVVLRQLVLQSVSVLRRLASVTVDCCVCGRRLLQRRVEAQGGGGEAPREVRWSLVHTSTCS